MKINWKRIGIFATLIALAGVMVISAVTLAQGSGNGNGPGGCRGDHANSLVAVAAETLGMERADLVAELQDGKTIAQVAEEQGVDIQAIVEAFLAPRAEMLAEAVAEGRITQEQADRMLDRMTEKVTKRLNEPFSPRDGFESGHGYGNGDCDCRRKGQGHGHMAEEMTEHPNKHFSHRGGSRPGRGYGEEDHDYSRKGQRFGGRMGR